MSVAATSPRARRSPLPGATPRPAPLKADLRRLLALASPVVLAEIGWVSMGVVDTIMVGPLGPAAIGAAGFGSTAFLAVAIFGMGLLLGLDTLVSQAYGAGRPDECRRWLSHGLVLGAVAAVPLTLVVAVGARLLPHAGLHPAVAALAGPYLSAIKWSLLPLLGYAACRRYLQGMGVVRPVTFALVSANLVNFGANWLLIYGHLGCPALGTEGAAWATCVARVYLVGVLAIAIAVHARQGGRAHAAGGLSAAWMARLVRLGAPAAVQLVLEVGVFAAATGLAGTLDPVSLASHQIAMNIISFVFMVPLGTASAGAVLVGQAVGAGDLPRAARAGWLALGLIAAFMLLFAAYLVVAPRPLLHVFTRNGAVVTLAARLLLVAAIFQLFDGLQVVATGVLRGVGDTRTPMLWNLAGHWGLGLPVGYALCFALSWGVIGLWVGLSVGLTVVGGVLVMEWARSAARLQHAVL